MGTPLLPNEPGEKCDRCWGVDQPFDGADTPKFIWLTFTGFTPGEFWVPDHEIVLLNPQLLVQTDRACKYELHNSGVDFVVYFYAAETWCEISHTHNIQLYFEDWHPPKCSLELQNMQTGWAGTAAYGGEVKLSWSMEGL